MRNSAALRATHQPTLSPHERKRHTPAITPVSAPEHTRQRRPAALYSAVSVAGIALIACAQLLLSIATSETAYRVSELDTEKKEIVRTAQSVREDLDRVKSPQHLAAGAEALGMVRNASPVYLRLSDGAVLGSPTPAGAASGTVIGSAGNQVPNSLLDGLPPLIAPTQSNTR